MLLEKGQCEKSDLGVYCIKVIVVAQKRGLMRKHREKFTLKQLGKNRDKYKKRSERPVRRAEGEPGDHAMEGKGRWSLGR